MRRRGFGSKRISSRGSLAQLRLLLSGCTDGALNSFTVDRLAAMYDVAPKELEYELTIARQKRAA